ncbi:MAG: trigger factor [Chthonomonadales bacterium]
MQVTREQSDPCMITLTIEVDPDTVRQARERIVRQMAKSVEVPGFRPGKAPRPFVERYLDPERVNKRTANFLADTAYSEAIRQEQIEPYDRPDIEYDDFELGQPFRFTAKVPLPPKVTLGNLEGITVERPVVHVTEDDLDNAIRSMLEENASLSAVTGRGVKEGDVLVAEISITPEGEPQGEVKRSLIRMGRNIPGFDDAVMGMEVGEERTFELDYPNDYEDQNLAGKKARFLVKVLAINERVLPELTDEWIQKNTRYASVDELRSDILTKMEENLREQSDRITLQRILDELQRRSEVHYPAILLERKMKDEYVRLTQALSEEGLTIDEYMKQNGITEEALFNQIAQAAERRLVRTLILNEIAAAHELFASHEELEAELDRLLDANNVSGEVRNDLKKDREVRLRTYTNLRDQKIRDFLFSKVAIKDVPVPEDAAPSSAPDQSA